MSKHKQYILVVWLNREDRFITSLGLTKRQIKNIGEVDVVVRELIRRKTIDKGAGLYRPDGWLVAYFCKSVDNAHEVAGRRQYEYLNSFGSEWSKIHWIK